MKERVLDIRIVGARAVTYGLLTSIPVALLALADRLFARRLEDARLATVFEVAIALAFSFWLRALHKRIGRFAERVFFACAIVRSNVSPHGPRVAVYRTSLVHRTNACE